MSRKEILKVRADNNTMKKMYTKFSKIMGLIEKSEKSLRNRSLELLNLRKGDKVLEIGFGRGTALIEMSKAVGEKGAVYGIDLTPEMIKISEQKLAKRGILNVRIVEGDARNLPCNNNYFAAGGDYGLDGIAYLFYYARPLPIISGGGGDDDDDDEDEEEGAIPFGNYYLLFVIIALISLIIIKREKIIFHNK